MMAETNRWVGSRAGAWLRTGWLAIGFAAMLLAAASPAGAQFCVSTVPGIQFGVDGGEDIPSTDRCLGAFYCKKPVLSGPNLTAVFVPDPVNPHLGTYTIRASYPFVAEGNHLNDGTDGTTTDFRIKFHWFDEPEPPPVTCFPPPIGTCMPIGTCGLLGAEVPYDQGEVYAEISGVTCQNLKQRVSALSLTALRCATPAGTCTTRTDSDPVILPDLQALLQCPPEPNCCDLDCDDCKEGANVAAGAGAYCPFDGSTGGGARLAWAGGGPGAVNVPGAAVWRPALGRGWSHDYAERIVEAPDDSHVWLITKTGNFREFWSPVGGVYQGSAPPDEYRTLSRTAAGWELRGLDGTVQSFGADGRWQGTVDAASNSTMPGYDGAGILTAVSFADGRGESFTYHPDGKLAAITEIGVDGLAQRSWSYTWTGDDLIRVDRPDGIAEEYFYGDARFPGYLTRVDEVATDTDRRVKKAWEYDAEGNVVRTWRGDTVAGPNGDAPGSGAVDLWALAFDDPTSPSQTLVTDPLGQVATYTVERDEHSGKARVTSISGDCPSCGLGPNVQLFYDDPANSMLPTRVVDASGVTTVMTYDDNGRMTSRTEALGTPQERSTSWVYGDPAFPARATEIEEPSTSAGSVRRTEFVLDGAGNPVQRTISGVEAASAFSYTTTTTYAASGRPETIDPPGYGAGDVTSFTYDPARGNLLALNRTDPIIGTTTFGYDALNRRTSTTDVNGVTTETTYDPMDRITSSTRKGASVAEDLVTDLQYNAFGDLERVISPAGNVVEYAYDDAGRLISIARGPAAGAPRERALYELDAAGNRTNERLQLWDGAVWETASETSFLYTTRCQPDVVIRAPGAPQESVTEYRYDCDGKLESAWDANHSSASDPATRSYSYDALGRLTSVTQPWGGAGGGTASTVYDYDVQDHLTLVTDAEGNTTSYTYSDRGLLTRQVSPVSGTSEFAFNEHGQLVSETDGRGVVTLLTVDALDRVTFVDTPESALDTSLVYDDPAVPFSRGRLTAVVRNGVSVDYAYDRFGRLTVDGELGYSYDRNGNRSAVSYPNGVLATYTHNFADRESTLVVQDGATTSGLVTSAAYAPSGPLTELVLGNGVTETRQYDRRYFPARITAGSALDWSYVTDQVGNTLSITDNNAPTGSRTFAYQDVHYFLTTGTGPWGDLAWTYDKIGNRLTETRDGATSTYSYAPSASGGRSPRLRQVTDAGGDATSYYFDAAGNQSYRSRDALKARLSYDAEGRLGQISTDAPDSVTTRTSLTYDGRGLLSEATFTPFPGRAATITTRPTYDSQGLLVHKATLEALDAEDPREGVSAVSEAYVFYFAGRPIGLLANVTVTGAGGGTNSTSQLLFLTADHLGTPALATDGSGVVAWGGGFEPFGRDFSGAAAAGVFLRSPGQWEDQAWSVEGGGADHLYNVYRWLELDSSRYTRQDPILDVYRSTLLSVPFASAVPPLDLAEGAAGAEVNHYAYAGSNPLSASDPLGLQPQVIPGRPPGFQLAQLPPGALTPGRQGPTQRRGCDCVNQIFENSWTLACCECHDACYFLENCSAGSWPGTLLRLIVPIIPDRPCDTCNKWAIVCFASSPPPSIQAAVQPQCPWPVPPNMYGTPGRARPVP